LQAASSIFCSAEAPATSDARALFVLMFRDAHFVRSSEHESYAALQALIASRE